MAIPRLVPLLVAGLLAGCAEAPPAPSVPPPAPDAAPSPQADLGDDDAFESEAPAPAPSAAPAAGAPRLPGPIADALANAQGVHEVEIDVAPDGTLRKISVYHRDAAQVPEPVKASVQEAFAGAEADAFEIEFYAGQGLVYEVEVAARDGRRCELAAGADGTVRYTECEIPAGKLPRAAREDVRRRGTAAKAQRIERANGTVEFEVAVRAADGARFEVSYDRDGRPIDVRREIPAKLTTTGQRSP